MDPCALHAEAYSPGQLGPLPPSIGDMYLAGLLLVLCALRVLWPPDKSGD